MGSSSEVHLRSTAASAAVPELRDRAAAFAREAGAPDDVVVAVSLAVSEAVANAVLHAYAGAPRPGPVTLSCRAAPGEVLVEVADEGRGIAPREDSPGIGVGLATIGRLAARMDVGAGPDGDGTVVRMAFAAPGVREARDGPSLWRVASGLADALAWPGPGVEALCGSVVDGLADAACLDVVDHGTLRRVDAVVHDDPALGAWLLRSAPPAKPGTATWAALRRGEHGLVVHDPSVPRSPGGPGERLTLGWWLSVPVRGPEDELLALWGLGGRFDRPVIGTEAIAHVAEAARRAAPALGAAPALLALGATRRRLQALADAVGAEVDGDALRLPDGRRIPLEP